MTRRNKKVVGDLLHSAQYIPLNKIGITTKLTEIFKNPSVIPFMGRSIMPAPAAATDVKIDRNKLKWSTSGNVSSIVYYFSDLKKEAIVLAVTDKKELMSVLQVIIAYLLLARRIKRAHRLSLWRKNR